ncbi:MAG: hypothetical protein KAG28_06630 [Cocleimonas sp.]|nr:hypothetical protein [Cocleimonas sp.]
MKKLLVILFLLLISITAYAGSADAIIKCQSGSGRTHLKLLDQDLSALFTGGELSIDKKSITFDHEDDSGRIISDLKRGVYVIHYYNTKNDITLEFYAVPKTIKKTELDDYSTSYKFNAIIGAGSTDPRDKNKNALDKTIWLDCTLKYRV